MAEFMKVVVDTGFHGHVVRTEDYINLSNVIHVSFFPRGNDSTPEARVCFTGTTPSLSIYDESAIADLKERLALVCTPYVDDRHRRAAAIPARDGV